MVIVCRNPSGEIRTYCGRNGIPSRSKSSRICYLSARIDDAVAEKQELSPYTSEKFNHVGLLAVEMFQTEDDEILVNEVAPRPHNSGHY
jgi:5-(carboxyamino)imidazole ribonucleotide synthase